MRPSQPGKDSLLCVILIFTVATVDDMGKLCEFARKVSAAAQLRVLVTAENVVFDRSYPDCEYTVRTDGYNANDNQLTFYGGKRIRVESDPYMRVYDTCSVEIHNVCDDECIAVVEAYDHSTVVDNGYQSELYAHDYAAVSVNSYSTVFAYGNADVTVYAVADEDDGYDETGVMPEDRTFNAPVDERFGACSVHSENNAIVRVVWSES